MAADTFGYTDDTGTPGLNCFVHFKKNPDGTGDWINMVRRFLRVPCVGEFLVFDPTSPYFRVEAVEHMAFSQSHPEEDLGAEIWCSRVNDHLAWAMERDKLCSREIGRAHV